MKKAQLSAKDLRQQAVAELNQKLLDLRREQFNLRMQKANDQLGRPSQIKEVRRQIARIKTVLNEKQVS